MASSQKASEGVKIPGGVSVIEQRRQSFARELIDLRVEAAGISDELQQPLIPTQRESRLARLNVLRAKMRETETAATNLSAIQERVESASQEFDPVTLPNGWFVGFVEPLERRSSKEIGSWLPSLVLATLASSGTVAIFYGSNGIASAVIMGVLVWGITAMVLSSFFMALESENASNPSPHSVFKGVIPMSALEQYNALKTAGLFDHIIVASPHKDAFVQMGVRRDPVMIGVVGPGIRFDWNGFATVESAGLTDSCVFLFEIARWDTAADLGNLGKA